jgi:hypothetical protein
MEEQVKLNPFFLSDFFSCFNQLNQISIPSNLQSYIQQLIDQHKKVYQEIENLYDRDHQPTDLKNQLTCAVESLVKSFL